MQKIKADLIITNDGESLQEHFVIHDKGTIVDIVPYNNQSDVLTYEGVITPGFVNAHCHLELSHLSQQIDTGTGLIPFITGVVTLREFPQDVIDSAIVNADTRMWKNGIVAVGDISNKVDTSRIKDDSPISYYTFVEMFDFLQDQNAKSVFKTHEEVFRLQSSERFNQRSFVPHAPYSVSPALFSLIKKANGANKVVSIHNQELNAENELFISKSGDFIDFYKNFGINIDQFEPTGSCSIDYAMTHMDKECVTLFVHNTKTTEEEIIKALEWNDKVFWVTCPNANLYIENSLPHYQKFIDNNATMCIGTDSLSSNWTLSILDEMITIKKMQSYIDDVDIIKWATINGARALGYDNLFGTIQIGRSPGLNLIDVKVIDGKFDLSSARGIVKLA